MYKKHKINIHLNNRSLNWSTFFFLKNLVSHSEPIRGLEKITWQDIDQWEASIFIIRIIWGRWQTHSLIAPRFSKLMFWQIIRTDFKIINKWMKINDWTWEKLMISRSYLTLSLGNRQIFHQCKKILIYSQWHMSCVRS